MRIFIDADGCPVVDITVGEAVRHGISCVIVCDTSHEIQYEGAETVVVSQGRDSADLYIVNNISAGDLVITQDYGVAAMSLGKGAFVLDQNGREYTSSNIGVLLELRAIHAEIRRSRGKLKSSKKKRSHADDKHFEVSLRAILERSIADA